MPHISAFRERWLTYSLKDKHACVCCCKGQSDFLQCKSLLQEVSHRDGHAACLRLFQVKQRRCCESPCWHGGEASYERHNAQVYNVAGGCKVQALLCPLHLHRKENCDYT